MKIKTELANIDIFSFPIISKSKLKKIRFTSVYNLHYGFLKNKKSEDFDYLENIVFISGNNEEIQSLKNVDLPLIYIDNFKVHTETKFENIKIEFVRGITKVKINNGEIVFKKDIPDEDIQEILSKRLTNKQNGLYIVKYEVSDILGEKDVNIITEQIKNNGTKLLTGLAVVGLILLAL